MKRPLGFEDETTIPELVGIVLLIIAVLAGIFWSVNHRHDRYVRECVKEGHSESFCDASFWAMQGYGGRP